MKKIMIKAIQAIQRYLLTKQGWVFSNNVIISLHGVKKIGGGRVYCADNVNINAGTMLVAGADIHIGKNSTLAYRTLLTTNANPNAPYNELAKIYPPIHKEIEIGDNVWIGAGAIVLPGCRIGNNCVIAAGSVVTTDIPSNTMAAGIPARVKKQLVV
ncbi:MAG: acyltransferase [Bacteroidia bacterium]|nr:acyltransferase [Bacteroidia bacterium]